MVAGQATWLVVFDVLWPVRLSRFKSQLVAFKARHDAHWPFSCYIHASMFVFLWKEQTTYSKYVEYFIEFVLHTLACNAQPKAAALISTIHTRLTVKPPFYVVIVKMK